MSRGRRLLLALTLAGAATLPAIARAADAPFDVLIRGGEVFDGTGAAGKTADVGVRQGKIVFVGQAGKHAATSVIEAKGLVVSPGFIDVHSHVMQTVDKGDGPFLAEQNILQGVTTIILGPDGFESPRSLKILMAAAKRRGTAGNYGCYVGHNRVREDVMGHAQRAATPAEVDQMKAQVREGMAMGCVGLSAGLMYDPGMFSPREEIVALAREVKPFGGTYDSHSRSPVKDFLASELETAEIGIAAGIPAKLGHIKAVGLNNKGKSAELIARVDALRAQGHDVVGDVYAYDGASTQRLVDVLVFPGIEQVRNEKVEARLARMEAAMATSAGREALKQATEQGDKGGFAWIKAVGYDSLRVVDAPGQPALIDKYPLLLAQERGADPFDMLVTLIRETKGNIAATVGAMDEADVRNFLVQPWDMISSDGSDLGNRAAAHPRSTGAFARVLGHYVRDVKLMPLSEAIRKMTSFPARHLHLSDRGEIAVGKAADIAIFDPQKIDARSDYVHPDLLSEGMVHVLVNGTAVLKDGAVTGATPGGFVPRQKP